KGFSLVEMLAAVTVFALLALMVSQLVTGASLSIVSGRKAIDADGQARFIFSRMAQDFNRMLKRSDVDMIFAKEDNNESDKMFFYSEVAAAYGEDVVAKVKKGDPDPRNPVSLVGYRVDTDPTNNDPGRKLLQLERLGLGLTWDESSLGSGVVFLVYDPTTGKEVEGSTLDTHGWRNQAGQVAQDLIGSPPKYLGPDSKSSPEYHVVGEQVFRFEYCFLLNSGTYSNYPVKKVNNQNVEKNGAPGTDTGNVGDRWFDTQSGRGYVCQSKDGDQRIWRSAGLRDVSAIVVAIAILDPSSRKLVNDMTAMAGLLEDSVENDLNGQRPDQAVLMEQKWKETVSDQNFAANAGIPKVAAGQVKIYQRYFYLNNPPAQDSQ
ncbi:MAG: prepilin-type N-terminal cleavage/methylation domain-containing protein, partial [Verrucomicrobiales bacterium]|nr:prepilin-type N-terminal cleavage/methylation domain-containing protein [Verrucomicrobiales bacterium]